MFPTARDSVTVILRDLFSLTAPYMKTKPKDHKVRPGEHRLAPLPPDRKEVVSLSSGPTGPPHHPSSKQTDNPSQILPLETSVELRPPPPPPRPPSALTAHEVLHSPTWAQLTFTNRPISTPFISLEATRPSCPSQLAKCLSTQTR